jgi:isochorismate synthase
MTESRLVERINSVINSSLPFAFYFYPGEDEPELVVQQTGEEQRFRSVTDLKDTKGFVIAPFVISEATPLVVIRPDIHLKGSSAIASLEIRIPEKPSLEGAKGPVLKDIPKQDYLLLLRNTIRKIRANAFEKAVISRTITTDIPQGRSVAQLVLDLKSKTDNAFVYLIGTPETGIWMGATPETLLLRDKKKYQTVSLAGTMPRDTTNQYEWTAGMKREQEIVSEFIEAQLLSFKIGEYHRTGPFAETASNVIHLKTTFEFSVDNINGQFLALVDALYLSPAVCGSPKEKARAFILENETHRREYYSGFLGAWNMNNDLRLFVNIRCMKIVDDQAVLFVGGGITANSVPEKEWEETNHKAQMLLSLISEPR